MVDIQHKNITGADAAHPPFYASESDPTTTLGAYRGWFKPSTEEFWIRNATNTGWHGPYTIGGGGSVSAATESLAGIAELATQGETDTGTDDGRIVTPLKAATRYLAKVGGVLTGFLTLHADPTSDMHAATKQYADELVANVEVSAATEGSQGIAELATQTETDTGTDDSRIITPLKAATRYLAKAGGTLTGFLTLHADPTSALHPVTKQYADALVVGGASPASETTAGIAELATQAETNTGTDDARIVTPLKLAARTATETRAGVVELATDAEVQTGTDTARAITSANLSARSATETRSGVAEVATQAETNTGTDDAKMVTPAKFAGRTSTDTRAGVVELATDAETQTGTDTARAITPANLSAKTATETRSGTAEIATQGETDTGTDDTSIVTPLKAASRYLAKAGGTLTGFLTLHADPSSAMHPVTKQYADALVSGGAPPASETVAGIAEIATTTETNTGTDDARIVTPLKLAGRTASETRAGVIEVATQAETDTGTDDTRAVTPLKLATYSGLGSGGSGNISGAYDIEASSYTDAGMSDEFASGTLDAKWNTATSSGAISYPGQPGSAVYDLTTRSGTLLLQPAYSTSALQAIDLRQADGLATGESLVLSCALPAAGRSLSQSYTYAGFSLNTSTTTFSTGTYNMFRVITNLTGVNSGAASVEMTTNAGSQRAAAISQASSNRCYLRVSRLTLNSIDSFVWLFSTDGVTWSFIWQNTASAFTQMWLHVESASHTNTSLAPVFPVNWIRHVASTAHDLW